MAAFLRGRSTLDGRKWWHTTSCAINREDNKNDNGQPNVDTV